MIAPLVALALAQAGPHGVAPLIDRPYRLVSEQVREVAGHPHHFTVEHRIVFRRTADGLVAEVTLERLANDAGGEVGARFLAGAGGLKGRTVRFHLADTGAVAAIDDQPAIWAAMLAGMTGTLPPARAARSPHGSAVIEAMAALPPERQRGIIASTIEGLLADPSTLPTPGRRSVSVPARALAGDATSHPGEEVCERLTGDLIRITTHAQDEGLSFTRARTVDAASGLLVSQEQLTTVTFAGRVAETRSNQRLTLMVP